MDETAISTKKIKMSKSNIYVFAWFDSSQTSQPDLSFCSPPNKVTVSDYWGPNVQGRTSFTECEYKQNLFFISVDKLCNV